jgi:hypothetical protein
MLIVVRLEEVAIAPTEEPHFGRAMRVDEARRIDQYIWRAKAEVLERLRASCLDGSPHGAFSWTISSRGLKEHDADQQETHCMRHDLRRTAEHDALRAEDDLPEQTPPMSLKTQERPPIS